MTDKPYHPYESAARELAAIRGIDPDSLVPNKEGWAEAAWWQLAEEIRPIAQVIDALNRSR